MIALGVLYRVRQFTLALGASVYRERTDDLARLLDRRQWDLFNSMSSTDQHHCGAVFRTLQEQGHSDPSLLRAALLHDVGKTLGPVRLWHRVVAVLAKALVPRLWESIDANSGTWAYPLYVHRHHATLGSELAAQAGCGHDTVWLIAHHEDPRPQSQAGDRLTELLVSLQAADRIN
jgi:hypothetical protein